MIQTAPTLRPRAARGRWLVASSLIASVALTPALAQAEGNKYLSMSTEELEEARDNTGIGGPIALLSVGGFLFLIGTPVLLSGAIGSANCNAFDCSPANSVLAVGAILTATGVGMGVGGGIWLGDRLGERSAIKRELKRREGAYGYESDWSIDYGFVPTPGGAGLGFGGTF